jgi:hypothetical protein
MHHDLKPFNNNFQASLIRRTLMRKPINWLAAIMSILLLLVSAPRASEVDVSLDQVPKPVLDAVKARFKDAKLTSAAKEQNDEGQLVYEVSMDFEGQTIDMVLAPEGNILIIEKTITAENLPSAVAKTLDDKYPKADYKRLEEVIKVKGSIERLAYYEAVLVTAEKTQLEVELTVDGNIVKESKATD